MGDSAISWIAGDDGSPGKTWNPVRGCSRVCSTGTHQSGCGDAQGGGCYAEEQAGRIVKMSRARGVPEGEGPYDGLVRLTAKGWRWTGSVRLVHEHLLDPLSWKNPTRCFVVSMGDPFHDEVPDDYIDAMLAVMALTDRHTYIMLTRRPERGLRYLTDPERPFKVLRAIDRIEVDLAMRNVNEEWRAVAASPSYEVSNFGQVRRSGRLLALSDQGRGYRQVSLCEGGVARSTLVHRLVLEAFARPGADGEEGSHRNGDRADNRIANLRWDTKEGNMQDSARQGTAGVWMKSRATLTPDEVAAIRAARAAGEKLSSIGGRFGIDKRQASAIARGGIFKAPQIAWPLPNLWVGVSICNRADLAERAPLLREIPAAVRVWSVEPQLEDLGDVSEYLGNAKGCGWVLNGCESGDHARPMDVGWVRSLRDQCEAASVPFFLKQAVGVEESAAIKAGRIVEALIGGSGVRTGPGSHFKKGGVIGAPYLDGRQHLAFPEPPHAR